MKKRGIKKKNAFYPIAFPDRALAFAAGFGICFGAIEVMFLNLGAALIAGICGACVMLPYFLKKKREKQKALLLLQFRDWLDSLQGSVSAGSNLYLAICKSVEDMRELHGPKSLIVRETALIRDGMNNSLRLCALVEAFATGSGLEDIISFADTLSAATELGGSLSEVISVSRTILCERIATEAEIRTYVASNRNELRIMAFMPFVAVSVMRFMGSEAVADNSLRNVAVKCAALAIFALSYYLGTRIIKVKC